MWPDDGEIDFHGVSCWWLVAGGWLRASSGLRRPGSEMYLRRFKTLRIWASTSRDCAASYCHKERSQLLVGLGQHAREILLGLLQLRTRGIVAAAHLLQRHVQLEDLFQQLRRHVLRALLADVEALQTQQILRALDRILQRPVGVVQRRRHIQRPLALGFRLLHESIGMQLRGSARNSAVCRVVERKIETARNAEQLRSSPVTPRKTFRSRSFSSRSDCRTRSRSE